MKKTLKRNSKYKNIGILKTNENKRDYKITLRQKAQNPICKKATIVD